MDDAKDYRGRATSLVLLALLLLTGSYNTKVQSFSESAVLEISYCISFKDGAIPGKPPRLRPLTLAHTWQKVGGVLQLPVSLFTGELGKK